MGRELLRTPRPDLWAGLSVASVSVLLGLRYNRRHSDDENRH